MDKITMQVNGNQKCLVINSSKYHILGSAEEKHTGLEQHEIKNCDGHD